MLLASHLCLKTFVKTWVSCPCSGARWMGANPSWSASLRSVGPRPLMVDRKPATWPTSVAAAKLFTGVSCCQCHCRRFEPTCPGHGSSDPRQDPGLQGPLRACKEVSGQGRCGWSSSCSMPKVAFQQEIGNERPPPPPNH